MRDLKWLVVVAGVFAAAGTAVGAEKLPDAVVTALEKAEKIEVYSLTGERVDKDAWHGFGLHGKTEVKGDVQKEVFAALKKGVADADGGAKCFIPRHGIRAVYDGKSYDLVICFECSWIYIYNEKGDRLAVVATADGPHKLLDKILTDAKIKLAKP